MDNKIYALINTDSELESNEEIFDLMNDGDISGYYQSKEEVEKRLSELKPVN